MATQRFSTFHPSHVFNTMLNSNYTVTHRNYVIFYGCYSLFSTPPLKSWKIYLFFFFLCAEDSILSSCVHKCVICCEHKINILCTRDNNLCAQDNISCSPRKKNICHFLALQGPRSFLTFLMISATCRCVANGK